MKFGLIVDPDTQAIFGFCINSSTGERNERSHSMLCGCLEMVDVVVGLRIEVGVVVGVQRAEGGGCRMLQGGSM